MRVGVGGGGRGVGVARTMRVGAGPSGAGVASPADGASAGCLAPPPPQPATTINNVKTAAAASSFFTVYLLFSSMSFLRKAPDRVQSVTKLPGASGFPTNPGRDLNTQTLESPKDNRTEGHNIPTHVGPRTIGVSFASWTISGAVTPL